MTGKKYTSIYVSLPKDDDERIDQLRIKKIKEDKKHFTKNDIIKHLIYLGLSVENKKYLKLQPEIDEFVSKLREITIEKDGQKIVYKKSKEQIYYMLIEKGLENLDG